jgi:hypothetical protein
VQDARLRVRNVQVDRRKLAHIFALNFARPTVPELVWRIRHSGTNEQRRLHRPVDANQAEISAVLRLHPTYTAKPTIAGQ